MKYTLLRSVALLFILIVLSLSCTKETTNPTTSANKELLAGTPSIAGITGVTVAEDAGVGFTINVPANTDIKALKINIPIIAGATISPDPSQARDYTNPIIYTVTGNDGSKKTVVIKVIVAKSSAKQILTFAFTGLNPVINGIIDQTNHKITATIPTIADIKKLAPTITFSSKATVSPASGAMTDFSNPVTYMVTAEDGSTEKYEVTVTQTSQSSAKCLLTKIENVNDSDEYVLLEYDGQNRVSKITKKSYFTGATVDDGIFITTYVFEYNSNGDVIRLQLKRGELNADMQFEYNNGKFVKYKSYLNGELLPSNFWQEWAVNEKNEVIEMKDYLGFTYTNGNVTGIYSIDNGLSKNKETVSYDNKKHCLSGSNFKGIFGAIWYRIMFESYIMPTPSINNNPIKKSGSNLIFDYAYKYNASGLPIECQLSRNNRLDKQLIKYTYSNCP